MLILTPMESCKLNFDEGGLLRVPLVRILLRLQANKTSNGDESNNKSISCLGPHFASLPKSTISCVHLGKDKKGQAKVLFAVRVSDFDAMRCLSRFYCGIKN